MKRLIIMCFLGSTSSFVQKCEKKVQIFGFEKSVQNARKILKYVRKLEIPTLCVALSVTWTLKYER